MNRIDRLHAILTVLQSKRVVRGEDLATRFNISLRTVYRDIRALEQGGIPIGAEAGLGYYLTEGFHLPPIMFINEEARALLVAGKFLEKNTDQTTRAHFQNALTKIRAVLDNDKKDDLEGLENKIVINPFPSFRPEQDNLHLTLIKQALSSNKVIRIDYESSGGKEKTMRETEPIGLCFYYDRWHLIAYCRLRQDYRDFRLDRILNLCVLNERFAKIHRQSLKEYLAKMTKETEMITAIISVNENFEPYIQNSKYNMGLISEENVSGSIEMTFAVYSLEYFARWVLMMGTSAKIISPKELYEKVEKEVNSVYENYKKQI